MANPQLEDGYTKISNEVPDHLLKAQIGAVGLSCVLTIIRQSWSWGKREAEISVTLPGASPGASWSYASLFFIEKLRLDGAESLISAHAD